MFALFIQILLIFEKILTLNETYSKLYFSDKYFLHVSVRVQIDKLFPPFLVY